MIIMTKQQYDAILRDALTHPCKTAIVKCSECKAELDEACDIIHYHDEQRLCEYCWQELRG